MTVEGDPLDETLAREPYLADGGFTERVLARLPPRRADPRPWVLGAAVAIAAAVGAVALPGLLQGAGAALVAVGPPAAGLALAAAGETLLAAAVTALALALAE